MSLYILIALFVDFDCDSSCFQNTYFQFLSTISMAILNLNHPMDYNNLLIYQIYRLTNGTLQI